MLTFAFLLKLCELNVCIMKLILSPFFTVFKVHTGFDAINFISWRYFASVLHENISVH